MYQKISDQHGVGLIRSVDMEKALVMELVEKTFWKSEYKLLENGILFTTYMVRISEHTFLFKASVIARPVFRYEIGLLSKEELLKECDHTEFLFDTEITITSDKYNSPDGWNTIVEVYFPYENVKEVDSESIKGIGRITKLLEEHTKREDCPEENYMFIKYPDGKGRFTSAEYYEEYCFDWRAKK